MSAPFELPKLPYSDDSLSPYISANTIGFHYGKHHKTYVDKLNGLVSGSEYSDMSLEEIIKKTSGEAEKAVIFNNAAQIWNHTFYWHSMKPHGGGSPSGSVKEKLDTFFGSFEDFKNQFANAAATQFGSGWAWLVLEEETLKVVKTGNAETPLTKRQTPLVTIDVWEHAYYLDYQNKRPEYINVFLDKLINWDFVEENLARSG